MLNRAQKSLILFGLDLVCIILAFLLALMLTGSAYQNAEWLLNASKLLLVLLPIGGCLIWYFGLHLIKLYAYNLSDVINTALLAVILGSVGLVSKYLAFTSISVPVATFVVFGVLFLVLSVSTRIGLRNLVARVISRSKIRRRVLIYGAGQTGQQLANALFTDDEFQPVCFVDDKVALQKLTISGMRVFAPKHIKNIVRDRGINRIVLAMPSVSHTVRVRIAHQLRDVGCEVLALPSFAELVLRGEEAHKNAPIETSKLLGRSALESELPTAVDAYANQCVLVTGAGGSIGSELSRQLLLCKPSRLVLLDHSEIALYNIFRELSSLGSATEIVTVLGSICESSLVAETLLTHKVNIIFHAAAYKHLPLVEENALEGLRNNILGTRSIAEEARRANVARFILVSSDKAVRPTSIMGSSKRLSELVIQDLATRSGVTRFSMVRFGNVMGSSGSVIPLFEDQIRHGGPLTVTHPDVTRYFMTTSEAVRLVLLAGSFSRGGDVFVLDMGQPVKILDIARKIVEGSGFKVRDQRNPKGDIEIQFIGLRSGEKMHEELLIGSDMLTTPHPKILRAQENSLSEIEVANALQDLRRAIEQRDLELAKATLSKWVEDYPPADKRDVIG